MRFTRGVKCALVAGVAVAVMAAFSGTAGLPRPPQELLIGVTHAQVAPDRWKPAAATGRAVDVMSEVTDLGNQHIMGFGALNPSPTPGQRDWESLDRRMELIDATGATPVITLCCAPDWMKGGTPGTTDWNTLESPPLPEHYDDFAALAVDIATRYPQVRHFVVWNELKGFADDDRNRWDIESYTTLYNVVLRALKDHDPTLLVGGPYVPMDSWADAATMSHPSLVSGEWGVVDQRALDAVEYWLANADGADFLAVDGHSSTKDAGLTVAPEVANEKFAVITRWLGARSALPVWWMELYPDVGVPADGSTTYQAEVALDAILGIGDAGGAAVFVWQPEGSPTFGSVQLFSSTAGQDGGRPQPLAGLLAQVRQMWSQGLTVERRWQDGRLVLSAVSAE